MKTIILNGSPRKNWNTAEMLKALNGTVEVYPCCDTLQVSDYSKFNMAAFSEEHKKEMREKQFPNDLEMAFKMGARLSK